MSIEVTPRHTSAACEPIVEGSLDRRLADTDVWPFWRSLSSNRNMHSAPNADRQSSKRSGTFRGALVYIDPTAFAKSRAPSQLHADGRHRFAHSPDTLESPRTCAECRSVLRKPSAAKRLLPLISMHSFVQACPESWCRNRLHHRAREIVQTARRSCG
jgi:hypothetical protein